MITKYASIYFDKKQKSNECGEGVHTVAAGNHACFMPASTLNNQLLDFRHHVDKRIDDLREELHKATVRNGEDHLQTAMKLESLRESIESGLPVIEAKMKRESQKT